MGPRLSVDIGRCLEATLGEGGLTARALEGLRPALESGRSNLKARRDTGGLGFTALPYADVEPILSFAEAARGRYDAVVVLGIGGSALGTIALQTALLPFHYNELDAAGRGGRPRLYVLDNVDPEQTRALLDHVPLDRTLFNVISKSGTTGETMAGYLIARERVETELGAGRLSEHFVFTTEPSAGALRAMGETMGVPLFDIPPEVGGRFSVLSPVGLLPAALSGMNIQGLLEGARMMDEWILEEQDVLGNPAYLFAAVQYLEDTLFHRDISVMMPYSARLRDVADWYRQLWAESLGKAVNRAGSTVNVGPLPVKSLGVTDQHSQLQLYAEGPDDKIICFLRVLGFEKDLLVPGTRREEAALSHLSGHSLSELLNAEQEATAWALSKQGRPSLTISMPVVDAFQIGGVVFLLEMATAVMGELYDIDAFDQPGVELSKQATNALMGRAGFERLAAEIRGGV
jgi:glucose-6-phosphate isomerase